MAALTAARDTRRYGPECRLNNLPVAAGAKIFRGAFVVRNATGYLAPATAALNLAAVGRAEQSVDNTGGAAGAKKCETMSGTFLWNNSAAGDAITIADVGKTCYLVDDQTVAKTDGSGARSAAGVVERIEASGQVWVKTYL